ncbi:MAG: 50S ribosomal protein L21e [Candidatus Anstonellales archaeon]
MKRPRGALSKGTKKLKKTKRFTAGDFNKTFKVGDRVAIHPKPYYKSGIPHHRYRGRNGVIIGKRGDAYEVEILDGGKKKHFIVLPLHIEKAG